MATNFRKKFMDGARSVFRDDLFEFLGVASGFFCLLAIVATFVIGILGLITWIAALLLR